MKEIWCQASTVTSLGMRPATFFRFHFGFDETESPNSFRKAWDRWSVCTHFLVTIIPGNDTNLDFLFLLGYLLNRRGCVFLDKSNTIGNYFCEKEGKTLTLPTLFQMCEQESFPPILWWGQLSPKNRLILSLRRKVHKKYARRGQVVRSNFLKHEKILKIESSKFFDLWTNENVALSKALNS